MLKNKRCQNFDMICSDTTSCTYEGIRVPNYEWLKPHTGVVYKCSFYKRTIVAAETYSNLFGITGCTSDKLYCNLHDSIIIWTSDIIDQCAYEVLLRTDLVIEDPDVLVDADNKLLFKVIDNQTITCITPNQYGESHFVNRMTVYITAEGLHTITKDPYFSTQDIIKGDSLLVANEFLFADGDYVDHETFKLFNHLSEEVCFQFLATIRAISRLNTFVLKIQTANLILFMLIMEMFLNPLA